MNASFSVSKQVAKSISMVNYHPGAQIYELSIVWQAENDCNTSTLFIPEQYLYPFAVEKKKVTQSAQASTLIEMNRPQKQCTSTNEATTLIEKQEPAPILRVTQKKSEKKEVLNFDDLAELATTQKELKVRKKQILKVKQQQKGGRKRIKV